MAEWLKTMNKGELILLRVAAIIIGIVMALVGAFILVTIPIAVFCFIFAHKCKNETETRKNETETPPAVEAESPYVFLRFKVAGVTFKNGRKTRQAILRALKWGDEEIETVTFEPYEWEGKPAVYVKVNDQIIGSIPSDTTGTFYEYEKTYKRDNVHCEVYGGSKLDDGSRTNYGSEITIRYLREV